MGKKVLLVGWHPTAVNYDHFLVFEQLINIVHEYAPQARIAFNTGPTDSAAAVQRWA